MNIYNTAPSSNQNIQNIVTTDQSFNADSNTFVIDYNNDRVGIGTTAPQYPLDVVGDINMSIGSKIRIDGIEQSFGGIEQSFEGETNDEDLYDGKWEVNYWAFGNENAWNNPNDNDVFDDLGVPFKHDYVKKYGHAKIMRVQCCKIQDAGTFAEDFGSTGSGSGSADIAVYTGAGVEKVYGFVSYDSYGDESSYGFAWAIIDDTLRANLITDFTDFVATYNLDGLSFDLEEGGQWTTTFIAKYKLLLSGIKTILTPLGKKVDISLPLIFNTTYQGNYDWDYGDFVDDVDIITIMGYDTQYDYTFTIPDMPLSLIKGGKSKMYGYGRCETGTVTIPTRTGNSVRDIETVTFEKNDFTGEIDWEDGILTRIFNNVGDNMDKIEFGLSNTGHYRAKNWITDYYISPIETNNPMAYYIGALTLIVEEYDGVTYNEYTITTTAGTISYLTFKNDIITKLDANSVQGNTYYLSYDKSNDKITIGYATNPTSTSLIIKGTGTANSTLGYAATDSSSSTDILAPNAVSAKWRYSKNNYNIMPQLTRNQIDLYTGTNISSWTTPNMLPNDAPDMTTSFREAKRTIDGHLLWNESHGSFKYNDGETLRIQVKAIEGWAEWYESKYPLNKQLNRSICCWFAGGNCPTIFDPPLNQNQSYESSLDYLKNFDNMITLIA